MTWMNVVTAVLALVAAAVTVSAALEVRKFRIDAERERDETRQAVDHRPTDRE